MFLPQNMANRINKNVINVENFEKWKKKEFKIKWSENRIESILEWKKENL